MADLILNVHGIGVAVTATGKSAREAMRGLAEDFAHFANPAQVVEASVRLELNDTAAPSILMPRGRPLFRTRMCAVHGWGRKRVCDYDGHALVETDNHPRVRSFRVYAETFADLYEVAYTTLLSAVGEALDARGFHRVHALGVEAAGKAGIVILPQGGGKSALAALLMKDRRVRIFSDETPLLHGDGIYPFPVRLALREEIARELGLGEGRRFARRLFPEKMLYPIPAAKVATPMPLSFVMNGVLSEDQLRGARITPAAFSAILSSFCVNMVVGIGVAQMAEHMLRVPAVPALVEIAFRRLSTGIRVTQVCPRYLFEVVHDARENARVLTEFLVRE